MNRPLVEKLEELRRGLEEAKKRKTGPVPEPDERELAKFYEELEDATIKIAKKLSVATRSFVVRQVNFSTFMPSYVGQSGEWIEEP